MDVQKQVEKLLGDILESLGFIKSRASFRKIRNDDKLSVMEFKPQVRGDDDHSLSSDLFSQFIAGEARRASGASEVVEKSQRARGSRHKVAHIKKHRQLRKNT